MHLDKTFWLGFIVFILMIEYLNWRIYLWKARTHFIYHYRSFFKVYEIIKFVFESRRRYPVRQQEREKFREIFGFYPGDNSLTRQDRIKRMNKAYQQIKVAGAKYELKPEFHTELEAINAQLDVAEDLALWFEKFRLIRYSLM